MNKVDDGIIYRCHSINNTLVRKGELKILRKHPESLYFEFGASEINLKKRYYKDEETLNKDFNALLELKQKENSAIEEKKAFSKYDDIKIINN